MDVNHLTSSYSFFTTHEGSPLLDYQRNSAETRIIAGTSQCKGEINLEPRIGAVWFSCTS